MLSQTVAECVASLENMPSFVTQSIPTGLGLCRPLVLENIVDNFVHAQSPDGIAWPERKRIGDGHPLLVETHTADAGSLFNAATGKGRGHIDRIEENVLVIGVDKSVKGGGIPGAGVHNYGFPAKQREFLGIGQETTDECVELFADQLLKDCWEK